MDSFDLGHIQPEIAVKGGTSISIKC